LDAPEQLLTRGAALAMAASVAGVANDVAIGVLTVFGVERVTGPASTEQQTASER
jgi:hypothetical protein